MNRQGITAVVALGLFGTCMFALWADSQNVKEIPPSTAPWEEITAALHRMLPYANVTLAVNDPKTGESSYGVYRMATTASGETMWNKPGSFFGVGGAKRNANGTIQVAETETTQFGERSYAGVPDDRVGVVLTTYEPPGRFIPARLLPGGLDKLSFSFARITFGPELVVETLHDPTPVVEVTAKEYVLHYGVFSAPTSSREWVVVDAVYGKEDGATLDTLRPKEWRITEYDLAPYLGRVLNQWVHKPLSNSDGTSVSGS